jgi:hypothetical protein
MEMAMAMAMAMKEPITARVPRVFCNLFPLNRTRTCAANATLWSPDTLSLIMPGSIEEGLADGFKMQFVPRLDGIMELLSRRTTAASAWLHIACINFFVGRHAALRAMTQGLPVAHTLALTLVTGPLGLFSHWVGMGAAMWVWRWTSR